MPIYEYCCRKCGGTIEVMHKVTDSRPKKCNLCGGRMERQISNTTFILKGTGWYATDYGKKGGARGKTAKGDPVNGKEKAGHDDAAKGKEQDDAGHDKPGSDDKQKKSAVTPAK